LNHDLATNPFSFHACVHDFYHAHQVFDELLEGAFIHYHSVLGEH